MDFHIHYPAVFAGSEYSSIRIKNENFSVNSIDADGKRMLFVTDGTVAALPHMKNFIAQFDDGIAGDNALIILGSGEAYKTIESVLKIVRFALDAGFTRHDTFVGIGGGVILDLTGFAASIFKRGASCIFVPTTLLSMVDASIGGKTGCDFENYKNMIGSFFPATTIYMFPNFLSFLPFEQYKSGLAEAVKTALLYDKELLEIFQNESEKILSRDKKIIETIIEKCAKAKSAVVEKDFTEKGERMFLNLGHTFAHALESVSGFGNITHGSAVAWGIGRAAVLSNNLSLSKLPYRETIFTLLKLYDWDVNAIPAIMNGTSQGKRMLDFMHRDKKNNGKKVRVILQKNICETLSCEADDNDILTVLK